MKSSLIHVVLIVVLVVMAILLPLRALGQQAMPMPGPPDLAIDAATKAQVIDNLLKELNDGYVFPDVAKKMEADVKARAEKQGIRRRYQLERLCQKADRRPAIRQPRQTPARAFFLHRDSRTQRPQGTFGNRESRI